MAFDARFALACAVVAAAGVLKGGIGFGAPLVAVPLLAALVGARAAIVLLSLPLLAANAAVLLRRPGDRAAVRRLAPLLATLVPATALGGALLARADVAALSLAVGVVALAFAALALAGIRPAVPPRAERPLSALAGAAAGLLNGATGIPGPLLALYLSGLRLDPPAFVHGITVLLAVGNVAQVATYLQQGLYAGALLPASAALIPAILLGQALGFRVRDRLGPAAFRRAVLVAVALAGANLLLRGLGGR